MANWIFHMGVGLLTGTAISLYPALKSIINAKKTNHQIKPTPPAYLAIGRMLIITAITGVLAIIPNIMMSAGIPESFCRNPMMNIFVLHPLLDHLQKGGILIGEIILVTIFGFHYSLIILAIIRLKYSSPDPPKVHQVIP